MVAHGIAFTIRRMVAGKKTPIPIRFTTSSKH
jgi:hypothetical protein